MSPWAAPLVVLYATAKASAQDCVIAPPDTRDPSALIAEWEADEQGFTSIVTLRGVDSDETYRLEGRLHFAGRDVFWDQDLTTEQVEIVFPDRARIHPEQAEYPSDVSIRIVATHGDTVTRSVGLPSMRVLFVGEDVVWSTSTTIPSVNEEGVVVITAPPALEELGAER